MAKVWLDLALSFPRPGYAMWIELLLYHVALPDAIPRHVGRSFIHHTVVELTITPFMSESGSQWRDRLGLGGKMGRASLTKHAIFRFHSSYSFACHHAMRSCLGVHKYD